MLSTLLCVGLWAIIFSFLFYQMVLVLNLGIDRLTKLHQVPCSKCAYFTGDYRLKCPINPLIALSEDAIDCQDFQANCHCSFNNFQDSQTLLFGTSPSIKCQK